MRTLLVVLAASLVLGTLLTRLVRDLALAWGLTDAGGERKIHRKPIPRLGGVAVVASMTACVLALLAWDNDVAREIRSDMPLLGALAMGGGLVALTGLVDDLWGLRARVKLLAQIAAACAAFAWGVGIDAVGVPLVGPLHLGWLALPATVLWLVLVTNAVNLIDGLDGLAGGVILLAGGALLAMSLIEGNTAAAVLLAALVGATAGFLVFNVNPASIFLGDTGSLTLGFVLGVVAIHFQQKAHAVFGLTTALLAFGLPIFDLSMAVVRRSLTGRPLFAADQHHVHHRLLRLGLNQRQSWGVLVAAALGLELLAVLHIYAGDRMTALTVVALAPLLLIAVRLLRYDDVIRAGRREALLAGLNAAAEDRFAAVGALREQLGEVHDVDGLWGHLVEAADALGLEQLRLIVDGPGVAPCDLAWKAGPPAHAAVHLQSLEAESLPLLVDARPSGRLEFTWFAEQAVFGPMDRALHLLLADTVSLALGRLARVRPSLDRRSG